MSFEYHFQRGKTRICSPICSILILFHYIHLYHSLFHSSYLQNSLFTKKIHVQFTPLPITSPLPLTNIGPALQLARHILRKYIVHGICRMQTIQPKILINRQSTGWLKRIPLRRATTLISFPFLPAPLGNTYF
jgi:hypothetical protein